MSWLVRGFRFPAILIHGDTLVWDRWRWLKPRLKGHRGKLLDIGCGSGAFPIGAAQTGYDAPGLSWDERNQLLQQKGQLSSRLKVLSSMCGTFATSENGRT